MIISIDTLAKALYIEFIPHERVAKTKEIAPEVFCDYDESNRILGIEMLNPGRVSFKKIARKLHRPELEKIHPKILERAIPVLSEIK